ncbi:uncharacterized protein CLUP02_00438 [Colletotrichum lupini]|uniref:Uncharacterized protein n=1 Tax=Colletotrichum lupini TaxID=145971 RepID=A0A9Q8W8B5_9PEZI|nr:uncharacterized protein CLUP02_00438 [Colletotrichum lupini]UQC73791.1 hypothetical protein CLUP02_00438 [Colletotrichum lupini]
MSQLSEVPYRRSGGEVLSKPPPKAPIGEPAPRGEKAQILECLSETKITVSPGAGKSCRQFNVTDNPLAASALYKRSESDNPVFFCWACNMRKRGSIASRAHMLGSLNSEPIYLSRIRTSSASLWSVNHSIGPRLTAVEWNSAKTGWVSTQHHISTSDKRWQAPPPKKVVVNLGSSDVISMTVYFRENPVPSVTLSAKAVGSDAELEDPQGDVGSNAASSIPQFCHPSRGLYDTPACPSPSPLLSSLIPFRRDDEIHPSPRAWEKLPNGSRRLAIRSSLTNACEWMRCRWREVPTIPSTSRSSRLSLPCYRENCKIHEKKVLFHEQTRPFHCFFFCVFETIGRVAQQTDLILSRSTRPLELGTRPIITTRDIRTNIRHPQSADYCALDIKSLSSGPE